MEISPKKLAQNSPGSDEMIAIALEVEAFRAELFVCDQGLSKVKKRWLAAMEISAPDMNGVLSEIRRSGWNEPLVEIRHAQF
jgi:hypothetical protein